MLNYLVFGIAIIIFATVIIISGKAISRGIEAKQNIKAKSDDEKIAQNDICLLYTSPSPRDKSSSRMPSSA